MQHSFIFFLAFHLVQSKNANITLLTEWPMIMAHDAATTYLPSGLINDFTKTQQDGGISGLLNCGARAFDWRPLLQADGSIIMHHGSILIDHPMNDVMEELLNWVGTHKNGASDLVILGITRCSNSIGKNTKCVAAVETLLTNYNISVVTVKELITMTASDATAHGKQQNGGSVIACLDCWTGNWNRTIACSGFGSGKSDSELELELESESEESLMYTCYADSSTKAAPLNRMWEYLSNVVKKGPTEDGLWTAQALWEETDASVVVGLLHGSSLLKDETKSTLNTLVKRRIVSGLWNISKLNMIELNNVCDGGLALKEILDAII